MSLLCKIDIRSAKMSEIKFMYNDFRGGKEDGSRFRREKIQAAEKESNFLK
jgi:hypothetical protein